MLLSSADPPLEFTTNQCHTLALDCPVTLYSPNGIAADNSQTPFIATAQQLTLIKKVENQTVGGKKSVTPTLTDSVAVLQDCHLILSVSLDQYEYILEHKLFHLKPEIRGPLHQVDFLPDAPILLELGLQPYIFQPYEHHSEPPENQQNDREEEPISRADNERAIALLSDLLTITQDKDKAETNEKTDAGAPVANASTLDPKTSEFIQDLLGQPTSDHTSPQPPPCKRERDPVSPMGKEGVRGVSSSYAPWQTTDGWLCRSVQQRQGDETVGYATLWAYATPEQTEPVFQSGQTALEAIATLLQNASDAVQTEIEQQLPQVKQSLSVFSDELITALKQVDWETLLADEISPSESPDRNALDSDSLDDNDSWINRTLSDVVKQFFDDDDWSYVTLGVPGQPEKSGEPEALVEAVEQIETLAPVEEVEQDEQDGKDEQEPHIGQEIKQGTVLQLAFQGEAGRWTCLVQTDDDAHQVVFYSLCPVSVPDDRYGPISELILRANDGLIIGNFELDFDQGDIRYKTSLDTEGDRLTPALMRRLVYANVQTMDTYLPGIIAVLAGDRSPVEAIAAIEQTADQSS